MPETVMVLLRPALSVSAKLVIYRMSQGECARLWENVPYVKVHQSNPKHLYPKLNSYRDNGKRKVWSSCSSTYCTCFVCCYPTLLMSVLQSHS